MDTEHEYKGFYFLRKAAFFMAGFELLLTLRVGLNAASFCLVRFKLEEEMFSLYVSRIHNSIELFCFVGVMIGNLYVATYNKCLKYISIGISWAFYLVNLALLGVFISGGTKGRLTLFYWTLALSAIIYGLKQVCIFKFGGEDIVFYLAAVPLSGIFVSLYHLIFLRFFGDRSKYDTDLNLVAFQIVLSVMITIVASALWTFVFLEPDEKKKNTETVDDVEKTMELKKLEEGHLNGQAIKKEDEKITLGAISSVIMCVCGLGIVYAIYPGIAPGLMVEFKFVHKIDVAVMVAAAIPSVIIALVSEFTNYGPNKKWEGCNYFWNSCLMFTFVEIICAITFLIALHHKNSIASKYMMNKPMVVGVMVVIFYFCHNVSIGVGFAGVDPNTKSKMNMTNLFLSLSTMITFEFLGEGYVIEVKKYTSFTWPTRSMSDFEAFCFWVTKAAKNALESLMSIPTTDLRRDLLSAIAEPLN